MHKLVVMAGGTGGHVFPGLAVAHTMQNMGWQIDWIGTADKMEAQLVPKHGFPIHFVDIGGVRGKGIVRKLSTPFALFRAFLQARKILKKLKPSAVLGMGGYASGPGGLAAYSLGIPLIVHEQNAVFGMTNRYLAKMAKATLTGFDLSSKAISSSKAPSDALFVGNPIRAEFFDIPALSTLKRKGNAVHVLVVGGSLGALALNQKLPSIMQRLNQEMTLQVCHQTGKGKIEEVKQAYNGEPNFHIVEFIDEMHEAFDWADVIICRAGALTVAEVAAAGRAAIFVPLPIAVDDHQTANATSLSDKKAAIVLSQKDIDTDLYKHLHTLCTNTEYRHTMAANARKCAIKEATAKVARVIIDNTPEHGTKEQG